MALVTGVTLPNNGDRIKAENYNDPITKILAQVNGNLDSSNLLAGSIPWESMASFTNKIPSSAMQDSANLDKAYLEDSRDHVVSGCVVTAGAGLTFNMSAGVVRVGGVRVAVTAITGGALTASKDTYISVSSSGAVTYTSGNVVANNAVSPALPANSIWLAIAITSGAAVTSVNIGNVNAVAPVVSSRTLAVSDTNGQLIYPYNNQSIIGYAQLTSTPSSTAVSPAQVTGLSVVVLPPAGKKIRLSVTHRGLTNSAATPYMAISLWEGVVNVGTLLAQQFTVAPFAGAFTNSLPTAVLSPSSGAKTYNVGFVVQGGTGNITCSANEPFIFMVEIV